MRIIPFIISAIITIALVFCLNRPWGSAVPMALGKFLSPQHGFWQNADAADKDYSSDLKFDNLQGEANVYFDDRLVPHVFADNDDDLYFIQGYLHAKFRLFQMDLQTRAAEGRASEIAGPVAIRYDREQRRLGMKYAAENALTEMEKDPASKAAFSSYTAGVNAYIHSLKESQLPLEYKILSIYPEEWSNLRTALLLKMMAKMLASGTEKDLANTNAKSIFTPEQYKMIYPQVPDSLLPIVPKGTPFDAPGIVPVKPPDADSLYFNNKDVVTTTEVGRPDPDNGSNNWVVNGTKTASGAPILCNDPHLELSLPSIWYEMQLTSKTCNVYGVTLPGSPFVIIGFNDNIAWGVTNAQRDVKDYFEIKFRDKSKKEYWFNNAWQPVKQRIEHIAVKGGEAFTDTVAYTHFGPVMYDENFYDTTVFLQKKNMAIRWVAHDPSNDGWTFYLLNRARDYADYTEALKNMVCPGQNFVFASKTGDIAIWQQGKFPARWEGQGLYVMPGADSSYDWQGYIPQAENPHAFNPERGFLESANQRPADSTYPYFMPGGYITARGVAIEHLLTPMTGITAQDMMKLQNNYYNEIASDIVPLFMKYTDQSTLTAKAKNYFSKIAQWDHYGGPASEGQTIYQCWFDSLELQIWADDLSRVRPTANMPDKQTTMELLLKDSTSMPFIDNLGTAEKETLPALLAVSLNKAAVYLETLEKNGQLTWSKFRDPSIFHLLGKSLLPLARTGLNMGGNGDIINAMKKSHGPSWRMVAEMGPLPEVYGVYPGGQEGNPGSKYYDMFVDKWVNGEYFKLWVMKKSDAIDKKVLFTMHFSNS